MSDNVADSQPGCSRASVITVAIVLFAAACLAAPSILQMRENARQHESRNRLKQIGLGLYNYYDTFNRFPPGGVIGQDGTAYHGWTTAVHTFIWASPWFNEVNFNIPWDDPRQVALFRDWEQAQTMTWTNPSVSPIYRTDGLVFNHYAGNQAIFYRNSSVDRFRYGVHAGQLLVADAFDHQVPVGVPTAWRDVTLGFKSNPDGFGCRTRDITQCLMGDGSVRDVANSVDKSVITVMAGPPEHFPAPEQVAKPRDYPLIDVSQIWRIERIPDDDHNRKNDRFRRIPPPGWKDHQNDH